MWFLYLTLGATIGYFLAAILTIGKITDLESELAAYRERFIRLARDEYEEHA
jgi:hypothetical protein